MLVQQAVTFGNGCVVSLHAGTALTDADAGLLRIAGCRERPDEPGVRGDRRLWIEVFQVVDIRDAGQRFARVPAPGETPHQIVIRGDRGRKIAVSELRLTRAIELTLRGVGLADDDVDGFLDVFLAICSNTNDKTAAAISMTANPNLNGFTTNRLSRK